MSDSAPHIAHIMPWTSVGGTEHATLRFAEVMREADFKNIIFYLPDANEVRDFFATRDFETVLYHAPEPSYRHAHVFLRTSRTLARAFADHSIDVVHCEDLAAAYHTSLAGRIAHRQVVSHVRNPHASISKRDRSFLWWVNRWVFVSQSVRQSFAFRVPPSRGAVIYDGVELERSEAQLLETKRMARAEVRREFNLSKECLIVGMAARVAPQKDYETLARAARQVIERYPDVRFLIVGDCNNTPVHREHYEKVRGFLAENAVIDNFIFTGYRDDVRRLMRAFDVSVLCTHFEGFGLVNIEAMAEGVPVIATAVGGVLEVVHDNETGLLHRHGAADELAACLLSLLDCPTRAVELGAAGRKFVQANFSREAFAQSMMEFYRSVVDKHGTKLGRNAFDAAGQIQQR